MGLFGYAAGKDPNTHLGWKTFEGADQTFDRKSCETNAITTEKTGPVRRVDARLENIFSRRGAFQRAWQAETGLEGLSPLLRDFYQANPETLKLDLYYQNELRPRQREDVRKYSGPFTLAMAYSKAMRAVWPKAVSEPPEISDFPDKDMEKIRMKDPESTSRLIKKTAHAFGSMLVGIARLNPDWVYKYPRPGRGFDPDKPVEVPVHWKYAVVVGVPMSWDLLYANPTYGTSYEAYAISRIIAHRLAAFIKNLGYAARPHTPPNDYDLMVPPIVIEAGLGEQGRHSVAITPEAGPNFRPAVVTTNLPLKPDKPINFGVQSFCKKCKICATNCPSGAIPMDGPQDYNGYRRYRINKEKCHNFWSSKLGNSGCRLCIAVCPYARKANWLHTTARDASRVDPTGLSHDMLIALQKRFYPAPDPQSYYMPSLGGTNNSYRQPPWWLRTEDFVKL
jgi:reductive dehalogenase